METATGVSLSEHVHMQEVEYIFLTDVESMWSAGCGVSIMSADCSVT